MDDYDLKPGDEAARRPARPPPAVPPIVGYRPVAADHEERRATVWVSSWAPFALGFFAALGVCAGSFMLLGYTFDAEQVVRVFTLAGVIAAIAGLFVLRRVLQQRFGFSGFGRGLFVGLMLGGLALGPCAGCYFLALFEA